MTTFDGRASQTDSMIERARRAVCMSRSAVMEIRVASSVRTTATPSDPVVTRRVSFAVASLRSDISSLLVAMICEHLDLTHIPRNKIYEKYVTCSERRRQTVAVRHEPHPGAPLHRPRPRRAN